MLFCSYSYTYLFVFVFEPFEGLKASYITVFWWRSLLRSQLADGLQTGHLSVLINTTEMQTESIYFQMCSSFVACVFVSPQPPDQVPAVQHHWWCHPGGFWQCTGQGVGPWWLQCYGVYKRRPVHCGYGQHQGKVKHIVYYNLGCIFVVLAMFHLLIVTLY